MKGFSLAQIPAGKPIAGTKVVTLHYLADPTMTPERITTLRAQYPDPTIWDREMEIDPDARMGQRVFQGFSEDVHVVDPFLPLSADGWTIYLGADPHPRRAHAFVWVAVSKWGEITVPYSWWPEENNQARARKVPEQPRLTVKEYVESIRQIEDARQFPKSYIDLMDQAGRNFNLDEKRNIFDGYADEGLQFWPAKRNLEYAGYNDIIQAMVPQTYSWGAGDIKKPKFTIMRGCGHNHILIKQFKTLRWKDLRGIAAEEKDFPREPLGKDRHLIDCVSYCFLNGLHFVNPSPGGSDWKPIYPAIGY